MNILGCIPFSLGLLIVALGGLYFLNEYRFAGEVLGWTLMWGLMGVGVGLALMGTTNRALAVAGVLLCSASLALVMTWHFRFSSLDSAWLWGTSVPNSLGVVYGIATIVVQTRARPTR